MEKQVHILEENDIRSYKVVTVFVNEVSGVIKYSDNEGQSHFIETKDINRDFETFLYQLKEQKEQAEKLVRDLQDKFHLVEKYFQENRLLAGKNAPETVLQPAPKRVRAVNDRNVVNQLNDRIRKEILGSASPICAMDVVKSISPTWRYHKKTTINTYTSEILRRFLTKGFVQKALQEGKTQYFSVTTLGRDEYNNLYS